MAGFRDSTHMIKVCACLNPLPSSLPSASSFSVSGILSPMRKALGFTPFQLHIQQKRRFSSSRAEGKSQDQVSLAQLTSCSHSTITGVRSTANTPKTRPESEEGVPLQGKHRSDSERKDRMKGREQNKCMASRHVHNFRVP